MPVSRSIAGRARNTIGTNGDGVSDALERNILSGNLFAGVWITGTGTNNNVVAGNYIGTDASGSSALGNGSSDGLDHVGIRYRRRCRDPERCVEQLDRDHRSERRRRRSAQHHFRQHVGDGIDIFGSGTNGNVVAGNYIGTNPTGTAALPNANGDGVFLAESLRPGSA